MRSAIFIFFIVFRRKHMKRKHFAMNMISVALIWIGAALTVGCGPEDTPNPPALNPPVAPAFISIPWVDWPNSSVRVVWSAVEGADSYIVYRSDAADGEYIAISEVTDSVDGVTNRWYTDAGLQRSSVYYYRVAARNADGTSELSVSYASAELKAPLAAPTGVSASPLSENSIHVSWNAVEEVLYYFVYRSDAADGEYVAISEAITASSDMSFTDDIGLQALTTYYYKVQAYGFNSRTGDQSVYASAMTKGLPAAPTGVSASPLSESSVHVSWNAAAGAANYIVYRSDAAGGEYVDISGAVSGTDTSYTDTGLQVSATYYYKVAARSAYDEMGDQSSSVSVTIAAPETPTEVIVSARSSSGIQISWTAVAGASEYYVYRATSSDGEYSQIASTAGASYTNTGLSSSATYYYKVAAHNGIGTSSQSSSVSATTSAPPPSLPAAPLWVNAQAQYFNGVHNIEVSWGAVTGATTYYVYRSTSSGGGYSQIGSTSSTTYQDRGRSSGTLYYYKVAASNSAGTGPQSSYASVRTGFN
jgi:fibronectin type 3 domain-containing protein